jgi:preprotein translocase subunit SecD
MPGRSWASALRTAVVATAWGLFLTGCSSSGTGQPSGAPSIDAHTFAVRPVLTEQDASTAWTCLTPTAPPTGGSICSYDGKRLYQLGPAVLTGADIESVRVTSMPPGAEVDVTLKPTARQAWSDATAHSVGKVPPTDEIAMVLDGVVVASPQVNARIDSGALGLWRATRAEANQLASILTSSH